MQKRSNLPWLFFITGLGLVTVLFLVYLAPLINNMLHIVLGPRPTSSLSDPTYTPTVCPSIMLDKTPIPTTIKPYLIIVLFEDTYQKENNEDIEMLKRIIQEKAELGDSVVMLRMEPLTLSEAVFFQEKVDPISPLYIPPTPTKYPTFTPIPTTIGQTAQANYITETITASALTATYQSILHDCAMQEWEYRSQKSYEYQKQMEIEDLLAKIPNLQGVPEVPLSRFTVWNGLQHATLMLENECNKYLHCILLIFSDMQETLLKPLDDISIYLPLSSGNDKVDVLAIMRDCPPLTSSCGRQYFWEDFFDSRSTKANFINENVEEEIKALLQR